MWEIIFLALLGLVWVIFATIQDLKTREISDWLNFSLIIFALGFRFFHSLFSSGLSLSGFNFFYQGVLGLGVFFVVGNIFYYTKLFAGGDAKLLIALGPVIALGETFFMSLEILLLFLMLFLITGAIYTLFTSLFLVFRNYKSFKRESKKQFKRYKRYYNLVLIFALVSVLMGIIFDVLFVYLGMLIFLFPWLHLYSKSVDESSMIKSVSVKDLKEGDWIYKTLKFGKGKNKKIVKARWEGLSKEDIMLLKKKMKGKKIKIRQGIPFAVVFLISYVIFFWSLLF